MAKYASSVMTATCDRAFSIVLAKTCQFANVKKTPMKFNWQKISFLIVIAAGISLLATGCGSGVFQLASSTSSPAPSPTPSVLSLAPKFAIGGTSSQTVTITGTGFQGATSVTYNGSPHMATLVSSQQLTISLSQADIATPGNYTVAVTNRTPGGGSANATFQVWQSLKDQTTRMSVALPLLGGASPSLLVDASLNAGGTITPVFTVPGSTTGVSGFGISIDTNDQHLGLLQWFEQNVDVNDTLISSGAYVQQTLPDGSSEIVPGSGSTDAFYADGGLGALSTIFKLTNNGYVVSAFPSTEPSLYDTGLLSSSDSQMQLELNVLSTVHF